MRARDFQPGRPAPTRKAVARLSAEHQQLLRVLRARMSYRALADLLGVGPVTACDLAASGMATERTIERVRVRLDELLRQSQT